MMRIDDVVAELELDVLQRGYQVFKQLLFGDFGDDVLLGVRPGVGGTVGQVKSVGSGPRG
jgi:hypothetical protein